MRVTGGIVKGLTIRVPKGYAVRPTPDMMRQAMFNSLGTRVYDAEVLELFAGSGALSLECISRGAHSSTCIEKARRHADILRSNWEYCGFEKSRLTLRVQDAYVAIEQLCSLGKLFDLILADPPFGEKNVGVRSNSFAQRLLDSITLRMLLKEDGLFLLGHPCRETLDIVSPWREIKVLRHGDNVMRFLTLSAKDCREEEKRESEVESGKVVDSI